MEFRLRSLLFTAFLGATSVPSAVGQARRPVPYPVLPSPLLQRAIEKGTRTTTGHPGAGYWTNRIDYSIDASLDPATSIVSGTATVTFSNHSPDALSSIFVHLYQNVHAPGVVRNRTVEVTGGVTLGAVRVGDRVLEPGGAPRSGGAGASAGYAVRGTVMQIRLPEPVPAGGTVDLGFEWSYRVPGRGAFRNGQDGEVWFMAYWFPQVAVYDDVNGWKADPYMGEGEFYNDYGTYDVRLTVPEGFLVAATGELQNAPEVLSDQTIARIEAAAANPGATVRVVDEEDRSAGVSTVDAPDGLLTWRFRAENVRDFAWGTSDRFLWDVATADVGDRNGDGVRDTARMNAFWRPGSGWERSAEFLEFTIEYLSRTFMPYPYPAMSAVEGPLGGGMEYPMMTLIGATRSDRGLFGVTFHETAHMYFPMIVGTDEKENTWMDEGFTSFNTAEGEAEFWGSDPWQPEMQGYYRIAETGLEVESRRHADRYPLGTAARGTAAYGKPAAVLHALRGLLGDDLFYRAFREYARRWAFRHPQPEDFFNTFEDVTGQDLDWFWTPMFYTTWTLDLAVGSVVVGEDGVTVTVEDRALTPSPVPLRVTYADGTIEDARLPVGPWLEGARTQTTRFRPGEVERVEIDPGRFLMDVDRTNNVWHR